jgi:hypothetical protein
MNGGKPILQGHFWLFLEKPEGHWERKLKALINSSGAIKRPLQELEFIGSQAQLAYGIKNDFNQRNSYLTITNPKRKSCLNTRGKTLRRDYWMKLMLYLHRIGLEGRLIDHKTLSFNAEGWPQVTLGGIPNPKKWNYWLKGQKVR